MIATYEMHSITCPIQIVNSPRLAGQPISFAISTNSSSEMP